MTGMTNNQAALLAACTANAGHPQFDTAAAIKATRGFKLLLDTLDKEDTTTQAEAKKEADYQALPHHCKRHLKEFYADTWRREHTHARALQPGEICQTPGCHHLQPATTTEQDTEA